MRSSDSEARLRSDLLDAELGVETEVRSFQRLVILLIGITAICFVCALLTRPLESAVTVMVICSALEAALFFAGFVFYMLQDERLMARVDDLDSQLTRLSRDDYRDE